MAVVDWLCLYFLRPKKEKMKMVTHKHTKKKILEKTVLAAICSLAIIVCGCSKNDVSPQQKDAYIKFFGSYGTNAGTDVKQTPDGGYLVLGTLTPMGGSSSMYLVKTDAYGNQQWAKSYANADPFTAARLALTDNGYIVSGQVYQNQQYDLCMLKLNVSGDTLWTRRFGTNGNDQSNALVQTSSGDYLVAGYAVSTKGDKDAFWAMISKDGNVMWQDTTGSPTDDWVQDATETSDGFVLIGTTYSAKLGHGQSDLFLLKIKPDGSLVNSTAIGTKGVETGNAISSLTDGSFLCVGKTIPYGAASSVVSIYKVKFTSTMADTTWHKTITFSRNAEPEALAKATDGGYWLAANLTASDGNADMLLVKLDAEANRLFYGSFGETGNQTVKALITTSDGGAAMCGSNAYSTSSMITEVKVKSNGSL
jgi:hypothetical protein